LGSQVRSRAGFPYFRSYASKQAYFDKSWQLNDIENLSSSEMMVARGIPRAPTRASSRDAPLCGPQEHKLS